MPLRRLLRGRVSESRLHEIAEQVVACGGGDGEDAGIEGASAKGGAEDRARVESVELLDADNWLSTPCVVNERWFVKVITAQNAFVHGLLTTGRNLGVFSSGSEGFFEHFGTPLGMAEHELDATRQMTDLGVNTPTPLEAFEHDGFGVLVFEYLPEFEPLHELDEVEIRAVVPTVFDFLARMHDAGLVHGDLRCENVLVVDGEPFFIDATKVRASAIDDARAYDVACALAALEPLVGADAAVAAAAGSHGDETLLAADSFLDFVNIRPDHDFDTAAVRGEISKAIA